MPIVIPTAEEVERMDARQKTAWKKRMGLAKREVQRTVDQLGYGDTIRAQAELWFDLYGVDPDAARHRAELMESM